MFQKNKMSYNYYNYSEPNKGGALFTMINLCCRSVDGLEFMAGYGWKDEMKASPVRSNR